jgi:two-component system sensor histidine kinase KdpD
VQQAEQGRLKIFLGAAPGVGKTYEMLTVARDKKAEGIDVVVGIVETHGRQETEALLEGLEVMPRRAPYKGHVPTEMDLDAILARRPKLVLVDELAHTNAPERRHPKRYTDVEELLAAGIDVYTTLNIQHVESINDIVAKITLIRVRETVPDSIIDRADDIEVIDLRPDAAFLCLLLLLRIALLWARRSGWHRRSGQTWRYSRRRYSWRRGMN